MELYGSDEKHDFWWNGPGNKENPHGLWNITPKGYAPPMAGYISKTTIERARRTRFDNPKMKRA